MGFIEVEDLSFSYPSGKGRLSVLEGLNFSAAEGEFISILGPSGCGKSTLLKLLSGFYHPEEGRILLNGDPVQSPFSQGQMIFQDTGQLLPWLTVEKNILFPRIRSTYSRRAKKIAAEIGPQLDEILEKTGLKAFCNFYPAQLSGGLKQRVSLARAIFADPQILFLDEPFVSLDAPSRLELQILLRDLWKTGGWTVFFVTHDISEALILSEKLLVFGGGKTEPQFLKNQLEDQSDFNSELFHREKVRLYSLIDSL